MMDIKVPQENDFPNGLEDRICSIELFKYWKKSGELVEFGEWYKQQINLETDGRQALI